MILKGIAAFFAGLLLLLFLVKVYTPATIPVPATPTTGSVEADPHMIPALAVKPIDPGKIAKAALVKADNFCKVLGQSLRNEKDPEFTRAMLKRSADEFGTKLTFSAQYKIKNHDIWLGMLPCAASASLGYPERVNRSVYSFGVHEQWVYNGIYLYFENGILTSWQD